MRDLTKKQKKILDLHKHISNVNELPLNVYEELELINDTEILHQNVDCYLRDNFDCKAPVIKWSKNQLNLNLY
jgi:hypothetical protein